MSEEADTAGEIEVGLCLTCVYSRVIKPARGSRYYLCRMSRLDPSFPRYPRLPVTSCAGYERRADAEE